VKRNAIVAVFIIAAMSTAGFAGSADNTTNTSYFEGVWSGAWVWVEGGGRQQDVTITIGPMNEKGAHKTTYAYGWGKTGTGSDTPPGSFAVYGREHDGAFTFWWKDKEGTKRTVTLVKNKENEVKARIEREGPSTSLQRPYYDAILKRK
jgi:hypothetical protein